MSLSNLQHTEQLAILGLIVFVLLICPLFAVILDFWAGIRKAKERGEVITSDGWRRTVSKMVKYYNMLLALLLIDGIQVFAIWYLDNYCNWSLPAFPWCMTAGVICVIAIEIKSIYESNDAKLKRSIRGVTLLAQEIARHTSDPEEIAQAVARYLNTEQK